MNEIKTVKQNKSNKQPANLEAEQALLGSILVNNDIIDRCLILLMQIFFMIQHI